MTIAQQIVGALKWLERTASPLANLLPSLISVSFDPLIARIHDYALFKPQVVDTTTLFAAPELHGKQPIDENAANVYSFAMLLWYLLKGEEPYINNKQGKLPTESIEFSSGF
jgi:hypothetical protein